jgi:hypothetical protein
MEQNSNIVNFKLYVDNSNDSITSNITKIEIRRDMKPALNQNAEYELMFWKFILYKE